jgi:excisionase family DNA binding protein
MVVLCWWIGDPSEVFAQQTVCSATVLTLDEAATLLRVTARDLEGLAEGGRIPGRRIGNDWRFECAALLAWLQGSDVTGRGIGSGQDQTAQPTPAAPGTQPAPIGEAPEERTAEDVFLRGNRVLLAPGDVVVDVGQFYARSDAVQLLGAGTAVGLGIVEQKALTTVLVARVGVFRETEVFVSTSFNKQDRRELLESLTVRSSGESAFSATGIGVRRTVLREGSGRPDVVLTVNGQIPSGDAVGAAGGGVIIVKSVDPVVLFASANYIHPFARRTGDGGRIAIPDSVDVTMGYGLGLNDTLAISMAVGGLFAGTSSTDAGTSRSPSAFSVRFGLTTALAERLYLEPSVSFGLSGPGHRFAIGVTMPYAF